MADLKLPKLPDRTPVKMTIVISPDVNNALRDYAALYKQVYGSAEPITELVPAILARLLESDRIFAVTGRALIMRRGKERQEPTPGTYCRADLASMR
jgi:hypothetical protein